MNNELIYDTRKTATSRCESLNNARYIADIRHGQFVVNARIDCRGEYYVVLWVEHALIV